MRARLMVVGVLAMSAVVAACGEERRAEPEPRPRPMDLRPREQAYLDKVEAIRRLLKDGEVTAGVKAARELLDDHRLDAEGWVVIATAYQVAGDAKEAKKAARTATEKDPQSAAAWIALGAAERTLGGFSAAEAALRRALELDPKSRAARFNLAGIAADRGQHEVAKRELTALVEADPDDFETRYLLATTSLAMNDLAAAKAELLHIVQRFPQHFRAQRSLAALAWADGDYKMAFERATIAARLADGDAETERLLQASFYVVAAARLTCEAGARPWPAEKMVAVLTRVEQEDGLEGAAGFVELDQRFGDDAVVQERVMRAAAAAGCTVPTPAPTP